MNQSINLFCLITGPLYVLISFSKKYILIRLYYCILTNKVLVRFKKKTFYV